MFLKGSNITQNHLNQHTNTHKNQPLHAHTSFIERFQRQLEDKRNTSFGTYQMKHRNKSLSPQRQKLPGPGSYNIIDSHLSLQKKPQVKKQIPFGTKFQRFKIKIGGGIPGPGTYQSDNKKKKNKIKRKIYYKAQSLRSFEEKSNFELPGPATYRFSQKDNIEQRRTKIKKKMNELKLKRQEKMTKIKTKEIINYPSIGTKIFQERKLPKKQEYSFLKSVFKAPTSPLARMMLAEKTKKYLPPIRYQTEISHENKGFYNFTNCFIDKKDQAYRSHIVHDLSDPGQYYQEKQKKIFKKKSSFFMSESKRKVFDQ